MAVGDAEFFLDFSHFPWFRKATIDAICDVQEVSPNHFYWPALDIDLSTEIINNPTQFPLVYQS